MREDGIADDTGSMSIHVGGPVETGRGFVLHSSDYFAEDSTLTIEDGVCLTATIDILKAIAAGNGPDRAILALGYAGWSPGQLETEIQANGWLNCPADPDLIFDQEPRGEVHARARQDRHRPVASGQRRRPRLTAIGAASPRAGAARRPPPGFKLAIIVLGTRRPRHACQLGEALGHRRRQPGEVGARAALHAIARAV